LPFRKSGLDILLARIVDTVQNVKLGVLMSDLRSRTA
jgi:hypothetical protein